VCITTSVFVPYNISVCALQHQCLCITTSVFVHYNISVCALQHQCVCITTSVFVHYNISVCALQYQCVCISVHYNISVCTFAFECQVVTQKSHTRGSCQHISIGRVDSMRESFCQTVSLSVQCKRKRLEGFLIYCSLLKKSPFWTGSIAQEN